MDLNLEKIITKIVWNIKKKNVNNHEHEKKHSKVIKNYKNSTFTLSNWQGYFIC